MIKSNRREHTGLQLLHALSSTSSILGTLVQTMVSSGPSKFAKTSIFISIVLHLVTLLPISVWCGLESEDDYVHVRVFLARLQELKKNVPNCQLRCALRKLSLRVWVEST
jgi:hypothetical protein